ncbi:MAG: translation initiation factor IF-6 [Methanobrevibacter sp.]|jgi:translation initiation factor 6|nr:translation initiation factor IF-6 [Candidatus Methanovirga aequatorialis]
MLKRIDLMGSPNLGVYISVTNEIAIVPTNLEESMEEILKEVLNVDIIKTSIAGSSLVGALTVGNSNGLIVSPYTFDREIESLENFGINVAKLPDKYTAIGNIAIANDNGAVVSPLLSDDSVNIIEDNLNVYVGRKSIAGFNILGSLANITNKGALLHVDTSEDEIKFTEKIFKVPASTGTVGRGNILVGACSIANSFGAIVPQETSGPEMLKIEEALGFLDG